MSAACCGRPRSMRLAAVHDENYRTKTFVFDTTVPAEPGQFVMLWLPGLDEKPFSVLAADPLAVTIAAVGPFTRALHRLAVGERVGLRGPFGQGFRLAGANHVLVGGGYGVAPMLFLARSAVAQGHRVRAVVGARTADDLLLVAPLRRAGADMVVTTEDGSVGVRGLVTDALAPMLATDPPGALYACGPHGMLAALERLAAAHALPAQLSWEAYMRCGIGICGSCEHDGQLLCADGPVLGRRTGPV